MINLLLFIFGLAVGSFLGVLVDRLPKNEEILKTRSHCDYCHKKLAILDLVPIVSYLLLGGKCRYCGKKLSLFYPIIEFATAFMFVVLYSFVSYGHTNVSATLYFIYLVAVFSQLLVVFFADLKYRIIPDQLIITLLITVLSFQLFTSPLQVLSNIATAFITALLFFTLVVITKGKGMGVGDVKLSFIMGLFFGWPKIIISLYLAFLTGAVVSLILILARLKKFKSTIAFGPFLVLAVVITYFFGNDILSWVNHLFGIRI